MRSNLYLLLLSILLVQANASGLSRISPKRSLYSLNNHCIPQCHFSSITTPQLNGENSRLILSPESSSAPDFIAALNQLPEKGLALLDGASISHRGVIMALQAAAQRGVSVEACVDIKRPENEGLIKLYQENPKVIVIHPRDIHTKRSLLFPVDPRIDQSTKQGIVFFGSENMSNNAGRHIECNLVTTDQNCIEKHYKDHQLNVLHKELNYDQPDSKEDLVILNSRQHNLNEIIATEIASPRTINIKIATMILSDKKIWNALATQACAGKMVQIIIDKDTRKHPIGKQFIPLLIKHGAYLSSYGRTGRFQHAKIVSIKRENEKTLDMISSANCTRMGNQQINSTMVVYDNPWFHREIQTILAKITHLCASIH